MANAYSTLKTLAIGTRVKLWISAYSDVVSAATCDTIDAVVAGAEILRIGLPTPSQTLAIRLTTQVTVKPSGPMRPGVQYGTREQVILIGENGGVKIGDGEAGWHYSSAEVAQ